MKSITKTLVVFIATLVVVLVVYKLILSPSQGNNQNQKADYSKVIVVSNKPIAAIVKLLVRDRYPIYPVYQMHCHEDESFSKKVAQVMQNDSVLIYRDYLTDRFIHVFAKKYNKQKIALYEDEYFLSQIRFILFGETNDISTSDKKTRSKDVLFFLQDPHVWTVPSVAKVIVQTLANHLSLVLDDKDFILANAKQAIAKLDGFDKRLAKDLKVCHKPIFSLHSGYTYLSLVYSLNYHGRIIDSSHGIRRTQLQKLQRLTDQGKICISIDEQDYNHKLRSILERISAKYPDKIDFVKFDIDGNNLDLNSDDAYYSYLSFLEHALKECAC